MNKLICLTYHYPPFGGVAVQRVLRFTRYLHEQGFECHVICAQPVKAASVPLDPELVQEIPPEVTVHRLKPFEPECFINDWSSPLDKIRRNLFKMFAGILIPDDQAMWIDQAGGAAIRLAREIQADALFATGPPFSTLLAGQRAAEATGLPLVVDFRDDWTFLRRNLKSLPASRQLREEALEQKVLQQAAGVLTVTPPLAQEMKARSPFPERVHMLPNGFDPEHFKQPEQPMEEGVLFYGGSLYARREPETFFKAWEAYRQRGGSWRFELAGPVSEDCKHYFQPERADCRWLGFLPHQEYRRRLLQASLNLAWIDPYLSVQSYTGKLLEYLGAGRPVLMLGDPECAAADLLQRSGLGMTVPVHDQDAIVAAIEKIARGDWHPQPDDSVISPFDARQQTAVLATILNEAISRPQK
ncbi:glycosyltransferase [bacterium]|nr:glycosyltransferase [bacterium]